ncbi:AAA family ATPase [Paenibacillus xylanexedens]|uniref:ATP-dependent nuclease n=1 Tax=Paenibacillus xylanexedens TaxID=528191 RepID=UPI001F45B5A0|nr:AAA family ATPase [Paenibacillus xylanexedens]MCF7753170.1 AAA family ATPase [Paenibacillus xylanexedens]
MATSFIIACLPNFEGEWKMYLHSVKVWNWRKFGQSADGGPGMEVEFNSGLNVLVGENDSGKTSIIDAIKMTLSTNSNDNFWVKEQDFYSNSKALKVECIFKKLSEQEEAYFYDWLTIVPNHSELRVVMEAEIYEDVNQHRKVKRSLKAGPQDFENSMEENARQLLAVTYLKPLRDAASELSPGKYSRVAQVVKSLKSFSGEKEIVQSFSDAFDKLKEVLSDPVLSKIQLTLNNFFEDNNPKEPLINNKYMEFAEILRKLELNLGEVGTGLGSSNLLFMAVELLLLSETEVGPRIALIEEIEAHIHPQAQLRVIKHFEKSAQETRMQYIFTSHSPILAASMDLQNLIFIHNDKAFSMRKGETKLEEEDYEFLERFLDATKANLFFARGVIFVEGDAENLLLPVLAEVIDRPLHKYGVSIVNVGSLAFKRYSSIFLRTSENKKMNFPVSIITDLDLKPVDYYKESLCYFKISKEQNEYLSSVFFAGKDVMTDLEKIIFVEMNETVVSTIIEMYAKTEFKKLPKEEKIRIRTEIREYLEPLGAAQNLITLFEEYQVIRENEIKQKYSHGVEETKVFLSKPWTLEHSIAKGFLSDEIEKIILNINYSMEDNKESKLDEWNGLTGEARATEVYLFLSNNNKISKAIVAQQLSKHVMDNKHDIKAKIMSDPNLEHLVNAIKHVTGGE